MPKFVIERQMPGAGLLTAEELQGASQVSIRVLSEMGPQIQWLYSYITEDKFYGVFIAKNKELVRQHARQTGFPADKVSAITAIIDPTTAEG